MLCPSPLLCVTIIISKQTAMTTLLAQRTTWTVNPNMEIVTEWEEDENCDTYSDQIEAYTVAINDFYNVNATTLERYARILVEWIYENAAELAELHAQWNKECTDEQIKDFFYEGVRDTLAFTAGLY